jgi:type IV secretory pathway VirB9-like protein
VKPLIPIFVACGLTLGNGTQCLATEPHPLQPSAPRNITVSEADTPPVVRAGLLQSTLILLPAEEKVATVFGGDTVDWVFDGGHVASRFISVKPKVPNSTTNVHIVSDHGIDYTLQLREISGDADNHFDSKVFLVPADNASKDKLAEPPVFVSAAELERVRQDASAVKLAAAAELKAEEAKARLYRSQYPATLHFDYAWDDKKGRELGLQQIWRDDRFTYLRGHFQETPALYETKDGKGSLINFDFSNGLYTVPKQVDNGYLAIGRQKVAFHRTGKEE